MSEFDQQYRSPGVGHSVDYAAELNPQQYAAVTSPDGPSLVIAGAGAGKTRTLIYRVAWLLEQGVSEDAILLLTFTNKAAREMMNRVHELTGSDWTRLWGGTFHSIGCRILRLYAGELGFDRDFLILDRSDSKDLLSACIKDAKIETKGKAFPKTDVLLEMFSTSLNLSLSLKDTIEQRYSTFLEKIPQIEEVYQSYTKRKLEQNKMDFDDLLTLPLKLFKACPEVLEYFQTRFRYVLVDEYQDTNQLQNEFVELISRKNGNLMVVGDDAQSIYSWRGACFKNILEFETRHPGTNRYLIETNYRSTDAILSVANASIEKNEMQFQKTLQAVKESKLKPVLIAFSDAYAQARFVAQRILQLQASGISLKQMAVLYRAHHHAMELQLALRESDIPFTITSGVRFFEQSHIKDITSFLRIAASPADEVAFKRLFLKLPGIGKVAADKLWRLFAGEQWPESLTAGMERCAPKIPPKAREAWKSFFETLKQIDPVRAILPVPEMIKIVLKGCAEEWIRADYENADNRLEDIEQLSAYSQKFETLQAFLTEMALQSNMDAEIGTREERAEGDAVNLSSIHQAKGLEYDVVFVIMLCEGMFPSSRSVYSTATLEEERRLFYVALTRARNELYLLWPRYRSAMGQAADQIVSRFIKEIPIELLEEPMKSEPRKSVRRWDDVSEDDDNDDDDHNEENPF